MKKRVSTLLILTLLLSLLGSQSIFATEPQEETKAQPTKSEQIVEALRSMEDTDSFQYALIENGEITKSETNTHTTPPATSINNSLYGIGSISKIFTTTAMMKLVELGKVQLDAPVTTYIPEFKMADVRYKKITVRMLLNHSSGLMGSSFNSTFLFEGYDATSKDQLLNHLTTQRLKADPGAFSVYCNDGFTLAEILIERVSGESFTSFIHKYITEPLDMKTTKTPADDFDKTQLAQIVSPQSKTILPTETVNVIGTGGIYSTAEDMCKFAQVFMKDQGNGSQVLSKQSTQAMASSEYLKGIWPEEKPGEENAISYGLGWDSVKGEYFLDYGMQELVKGGDTHYYHGSMVVLPEYNMAAVVLSSGGLSPYGQFLAEELLTEALVKKGILPQNDKPLPSLTDINISTPPAMEIPAEVLANQGFYASASMMKVDMTTQGAMQISVPDVPGYVESYFYVGDGVFQDATRLVNLSFAKEENGLTYLQVAGPSILPPFGTMYTNQYSAQKVETSNALTTPVSQAWEARNGKSYYLLNENYSSQTYMMATPVVKIALSKNASEGGIDGYLGTLKIEGEDTAKAILQIPGSAGRDLYDFNFHKENGLEYLSFNSNLAVSEDGLHNLYNGANATCTIQDTGHAVWYKVGDSAKKTMTITMPKNASFSVYNQAGGCVTSSKANGKTSVLLPTGGMIVFAGDVGSQFQIKLQ